MEACEQARRWSPSIQLGVNCTIHQLRRGEVSKAVARALEETGFRSGQLTLEVTEDAIVDSAASADLKALSDMGVQLSVDDVGTNWSSFEPFKRHSISTVKIDGSFIAGLEPAQGINRLVVETVIHMAHSLGMSAIVERVETAAQVEIVRSFNADAAQGFFFARPMSSDDAVAFASGPELPQFSCKEIRTLVSSRTGSEGVISLDGPGSGTAAADIDSADVIDEEAVEAGVQPSDGETDLDGLDLTEATAADGVTADGPSDGLDDPSDPSLGVA